MKARIGVYDLALYLVVVGSSTIISLVNIAGSLRVLDLSASPTLLSLSTTLYNLAFVFMSMFWVRLFGYHLSRRGLSLITLAGLASGSLLIGLSDDVLLVVVGNAIVGFFGALITPTFTTLLLERIGRDSVAVVRYNAFSGLGYAIGYLVGGVFRSVFPIPELLLMASAASMVLLPLAVLIPGRTVIVEVRKYSQMPLVPQVVGRSSTTATLLPRFLYDLELLIVDFLKMVRRNLSRKLPLYFLGLTSLFTGISLFFTPMPAFLRVYGFSDGEVYLVSLIASTASIVAYRFTYGYVKSLEVAWSTLIRVVAVRVFLFSTPMIAILTCGGVCEWVRVFIYLLYVLAGFTWAFISTSTSMIVVSISEIERRDIRLSHMNVSIGVGTILGSAISSLLIGLVGFGGVFLAAIIFILVSTLVFDAARRAVVT